MKTTALQTAAYCRVSTQHEEQENSLTEQTQFFTRYVEEHSEFTLYDIYTEKESATTTASRTEFTRLLSDCKKGNIQHIVTKSIHRFARNTLDFLTIFRLLNSLGVTIHFFEESIDTRKVSNDLLLSMGATMAQHSSIQKSRSIQWGIHQRFRMGKAMLADSRFLGYRKNSYGQLVVVPKEAEIIRLIYNLYLTENYGVRKIAQYLEEQEIPSPTGLSHWSKNTVRSILSNEKYCGDLLQQKTYVEDPLSHRQVKNNGERTQYYTKNNHRGIVSRKVFVAVQQKTAERRKQYGK